jgi:hypothetical protein
MHNDEESLSRAAEAMIRSHGLDAGKVALVRAEELERVSTEWASHWREVARLIGRLLAHA